ncbi:MAG: D-glycero-beta-D-manno-heptose 1,7-bisphosphate 7-phosphatase [Dehalococcoidia bacterium]|nr:D-glycero-beta-D-manno-heptose 1,7-bisphosphate 7-phosphatase [Dehalococcoidia bacterium]
MELVGTNRAVFLDRDGTIARDVPYCSRLEDFELLEGVGEGIRMLSEAGFKVIVVTNQSGIARGYFTEAMLDRIHQKMKSDSASYGAHIDAIYYCPHHPDEGCDCRKPKPTLILRAAREHNIDLTESFSIGDKLQDIEAGHAAGCRTVLIIPVGDEATPPEEYSMRPDFKAENFKQACDWVVINTVRTVPSAGSLPSLNGNP